MKKTLNYINALPDFLAMQRVSFCWFITQGLTDELSFFSRIHDFSKTTEYVMFGDEFSLVKPPRSFSMAQKYIESYKVQLIIPTEVRDKTLNLIFRDSSAIITLPLMTTYATFLINGCERVIVSQIIRSPGIYFEKNKNQRRQNIFKRKVSTSLSKVRSFVPTGEAFLSELDLFFAIPTLVIIGLKDPKERIVPYWNSNLLSYYSLNSLKLAKKKPLFNFLQSFKFYQMILKIRDKKLQISFIQLFLKWLKNYQEAFKLDLNLKKIYPIYLLESFQFLTNVLEKYEVLSKTQFLNVRLKVSDFSRQQLLNLLSIYDQRIINTQLATQITLNSQIFLIFQEILNNFLGFGNFKFLKITLRTMLNRVDELIARNNFLSLQPTIYFSKSLKDQLRYIYDNNLKEDIDEEPNKKYHKYLKTKTQFLLYKQDHEIKSYYHIKYEQKDLYTAILIPEYGSWVRFGFQKNIRINPHKYPVKNQEDEVIIQFDKIDYMPVLLLFKEMGLTDKEIFQNLEHADFFYFDKPLLLNSFDLNQPLSRFNQKIDRLGNLSEFTRIFDYNYYRIGRVGRLKFNDSLNLEISERLQVITYEDIFAIIDKLITLTISKNKHDDIDHLKNRRVRSIGELLQSLFRIGFQRLIRKLHNQPRKKKRSPALDFNIINATIHEFFGSSQLSQYLDQTNPLSSLTHRRRISGLGPGGFDRDRISFAVRDIHPSHYGRICPIETPEGQNVGLIASLTTCARVNKSGFLETPFWRVINGKVIKTGNPIYLTADIEDLYKIAPADLATNSRNYLLKNVIPVRYQQDFVNVSIRRVDFIAISTVQMVSVAASLIPFFEHDDANRALMGSNMQRQSVPLILPQKPIVGTGLENQIAIDSGLTLTAKNSGRIHSVTAAEVIIDDIAGKKRKYKLKKYLRSNQQTCINQRPIVWKGEYVKSGQMLTDGPAISHSELALGQNVLVAYMPWQGYNFEDAILISERLIYDDIFTSIHIERYKIAIDRTRKTKEETTKNIPDLDAHEIKHLNEDGIVKIGTFLRPGDIIVGKVTSNKTSEQLPESKLLRAIFGSKSKGVKDTSYRMPEGESGRVIDIISFNQRTKRTYKVEKIHIFVAQIRKIKIGDKIAGRHGNKGIISKILARQDMPFLPDGTPIDIILNPLGVPSRMNVGQLYECLLGLAGDKLNTRFKILPFDEMYGTEMSRILINKKLRQASIQNNESWLFNPYAPGKMVLIDGRTGNEFENPITVGNAYMLKLIHLVDDKMHARATGPYSLITQQPLRGKAQHGGQRFGEMEVWALESFGAAFTLKEILTIKSDDVEGRNETLTSIVKGQEMPPFGVPESFKVLLQELRSIGLDMITYKVKKFSSKKGFEEEVNLIEKYNAQSKTFSETVNPDDILF